MYSMYGMNRERGIYCSRIRTDYQVRYKGLSACLISLFPDKLHWSLNVSALHTE